MSRADVYLLADTTGSMFTVIDAVKAGADAIVNASYGGVAIAFGVGNYRDLPETSPPFVPQLALTADKAAVVGEINTWAATAGGDLSEGQLLALQQLAEPPGGPIGWRANSKRMIVWFGDAPGHDPICAAISALGVDNHRSHRNGPAGGRGHHRACHQHRYRRPWGARRRPGR